MSTSVLDRPSTVISQPLVTPLDCEERRASQPDVPATWLSRMMLKSYMSSFNLFLSELGWVPRRILEVGSGDGTMLSYVAQTFMQSQVIGVEFDPETIAEAKEKNCCRIEFVEISPAETLPFKDNYFDVVISHGFLGRSGLPRHWVKEMSRVSAEGLILSAPTPMGYKWVRRMPGAQDAKLIGKKVFQPGVEPVGLAQMKTWVERSGLTVESVASPLPYTMILARKPQTKP